MAEPPNLDISQTVVVHRRSEYPVDPLFIDRWSSRAFTGEPIPEAHLYTAFEAARWAPSSLNYQPWRFVFAHRDTPEFDDLFALLNERNQLWAHKASALVFFVSDTVVVYRDKAQPSSSHAFDTGAAWANFAHQAFLLGYRTRAIGGFDRDAAPEVLGLPDQFQAHCAIAIGVPDEPHGLPEAFIGQERPSDRRPLSDLVFEGTFRSPS